MLPVAWLVPPLAALRFVMNSGFVDDVMFAQNCDARHRPYRPGDANRSWVKSACRPTRFPCLLGVPKKGVQICR